MKTSLSDMNVATMLLIVLIVLSIAPRFRGETAGFVFNTEAGGKVAPLLPEEYVTSFVQHKWDANGFGVNHVSAGTIWNSYRRKMSRVDSAQHDWRSNNGTVRGPRIGTIQMSIFDFNKRDGTVNNIIYQRVNMKTGSCSNYTIPLGSAVMQMFARDFLRTANALFAGQETIIEYGLSDKWLVIFGDIPITFYFDKTGQWFRLDFTSPASTASVVTQLFNMDATQELVDEVFDGVYECRAFS